MLVTTVPGPPLSTVPLKLFLYNHKSGKCPWKMKAKLFNIKSRQIVCFRFAFGFHFRGLDDLWMKSARVTWSSTAKQVNGIWYKQEFDFDKLHFRRKSISSRLIKSIVSCGYFCKIVVRILLNFFDLLTFCFTKSRVWLVCISLYVLNTRLNRLPLWNTPRAL